MAQEFQFRSYYCLILIVVAISGSTLFTSGLIHCDSNQDLSEEIIRNICWTEKSIYILNFTKGIENETRYTIKQNETIYKSYGRKRLGPAFKNNTQRGGKNGNHQKIPVYRTGQRVFEICMKLAIIYVIPYFVFRILGGEDFCTLIKG